MAVNPGMKRQLSQAMGFDTVVRAALLSVENEIPKCTPDDAVYGLCRIALEHGSATIRLFHDDNPIAACALVRLQYEAVVRSFWLKYGAPIPWLEKAGAVMRKMSEVEPQFPPINAMLLALEVSSTAPESIHTSLATFQSKAWTDLNSFTHGGFKSICRSLVGHELPLQQWMLTSSTTLTYTAAMLCATVASNQNRLDEIYIARNNYPTCFHPMPKPTEVTP